MKLQTYTADTITLDLTSDDFVISDTKGLWNNKSLYYLNQFHKVYLKNHIRIEFSY